MVVRVIVPAVRQTYAQTLVQQVTVSLPGAISGTGAKKKKSRELRARLAMEHSNGTRDGADRQGST